MAAKGGRAGLACLAPSAARDSHSIAARGTPEGARASAPAALARSYAVERVVEKKARVSVTSVPLVLHVLEVRSHLQEREAYRSWGTAACG